LILSLVIGCIVRCMLDSLAHCKLVGICIGLGLIFWWLVVGDIVNITGFISIVWRYWLICCCY